MHVHMLDGIPVKIVIIILYYVIHADYGIGDSECDYMLFQWNIYAVQKEKVWCKYGATIKTVL